MNSLREYWTPLVNAFDPLPLLGKKAEACYVEREDSPVPLMALALQPGRLGPPVLMTGARGTGKTTALMQLARQLSQEYMVIWIDLHASLDLYHTSILDLLLSLGGGAYTVARRSGLEPDPRPWQEVVAALETLIGQVRKAPDHRISADELLDGMVCARADPSESLDLYDGEVKPHRWSLALAKEEFRQLQAGAVLREMVKRTNLILADVAARAGRDTLIICDGLDKLEPALAGEVFEYRAVLTELRGRAIYTFPYRLYKTVGDLSDDFVVYDLPNVRLHPYRKPDKQYAPGFATLREVARRRVEAVGHILEEVFEPQALEILSVSSGGVLRVFIRLIRTAATYAEFYATTTISPQHARLAEAEEKRRRAGALNPDDIAYLKHFLETGQRGSEEMFLKQVHDGNIVAYSESGDFWYEVHPVAAQLVKDREDKEVRSKEVMD